MPSSRSSVAASYHASSPRRGRASLALLLGLGAACASGQTAWTGAAGDGVWTNDGNWSNNAPTAVGQATFNGEGQSVTITNPNFFSGTTFTSGSYTFSSTVLGFSALTVNGGTQTVTTTVSLNNASLTVASGATLVLSADSNRVNGAASISGAGNYNIGSIATGMAGTLTMNGTGRLTLTGASSYARPLTMADGTLSLGTSIGVRTFSNAVTLNAGSTTALRLNGNTRGSTYDGLTLTGSLGTLGYGGTLALSFGGTFADGDVLHLFSATTFTAGRSFDAITGTGTYGGTFLNDNGIWTMTSGDRMFEFKQSTGDLTVSAVTTPVPEPSAYAAMAGAGALGLALWRRRGRDRAV